LVPEFVLSVRLATWNINSVRLRLPLVMRLAESHAPDVICLQEIKCQNDQFPAAAFAAAGYPHQVVNGQKGYHGVAIVSKLPLSGLEAREFCNMGDSRHVSAIVEAPGGGFRLHSFYIPSGGDEPDPKTNPKFRHKLDFLAELTDWFDDTRFEAGHVIVGDFNIAPHENDVWSHKQLLKIVSHTPVETEALDALQGRRDWADLLRRHVPYSEKIYSWWSYRARDWDASDRGRRLDHIWSTPELADRCTGAEIVRQARGWTDKPSDHVPVIATLG
jgi:exodeoxyribonuclease III